MNEENTELNNEIVLEDKPYYDEFLPGPIQVLVEWIILLISTLVSFLSGKEE